MIYVMNQAICVKLVTFLKNKGQDVNGGRCVKKINGNLRSAKRIEKECGKKYKKMMNKENARDQKTKIGIVEGPVEEVFLENNKYNKKMKLGKASRLSEVNMEMINASGKVGIDRHHRLKGIHSR